MNKELLEEKIQFVLHFCYGYKEYGNSVSESDGFAAINNFIVALCNRAIALNMAFYDLTTSEVENYIAAIPLIRLIIDNSLTGYGALLSGDPLKYITFIQKGHEARDFVTKEKGKLREGIIVKELDQEIKGIKELYKKTCTYIHFSADLINSAVQQWKGEDGKNHINMNICKVDGSFTDEAKLAFWDDLIGANIYMMGVIAKWDDYIKEVEMPMIEQIYNKHQEEILESYKQLHHRENDIEPLKKQDSYSLS